VFVAGFVALGLGVAGALAGYAVAAFLAAIVGGVVIYRRFYVPNPTAETAEPDSPNDCSSTASRSPRPEERTSSTRRSTPCSSAC